MVVGIHKAAESRKAEIRRSCWIRSRKRKLALWMRRRWDAKVVASPEGRLRRNAPVEGHCRAGRPRTGHMVGTLRWKKLDDFTIGDETLIQSAESTEHSNVKERSKLQEAEILRCEERLEIQAF